MRDLDTIDQTMTMSPSQRMIAAMIADELICHETAGSAEAGFHDHVSHSWHFWDFWDVTDETRRAAFDIDTGRLSGLVLIAELEGLPVVLEVL